VGLVNLKVTDKACVSQCENIYNRLREAGIDVLYDDRDERPGAKFADMDLIGLPWQLVVGPRELAVDRLELKRRDGGAREELSLESVLAKLTG
jgi:prolyl-tRNA synthetase